MKLIVSVFTTFMLILSSGAQASFDMRQEYKTERETYSSRVKSGYKLENNISLDFEIKFRSEDETKFMENLEINGKEITFGYHYKLNDEWTLSPGLPIETSYGDETYKPQIRLIYRPKHLKSLAIAGRYRLDIKPHESVGKLRHRFTYTASYIQSPNWSWGYEGNYYYADNSNNLLFDNKRSNYEQNIKINFIGGAWSPYLEFGNISVASNSDHRELRVRAGLRYAFNFYERDKVHSHLD